MVNSVSLTGYNALIAFAANAAVKTSISLCFGYLIIPVLCHFTEIFYPLLRGELWGLFALAFLPAFDGNLDLGIVSFPIESKVIPPKIYIDR